MLDACLGTLIWWACGYTFMYGSMADGADGTPLQAKMERTSIIKFNSVTENYELNFVEMSNDEFFDDINRI